MKLRSRRQDHGTDKYRPLTPHFILTVARNRNMAYVLSHIELWRVRTGAVQGDLHGKADQGELKCNRVQLTLTLQFLHCRIGHFLK